MSQENLIVDSRLYNLSTRSTGCNILNTTPDYNSQCEFHIPNMIERDETIEYIMFSIPKAVIPVSFYTMNANFCRLDVIENIVTASYNCPYGNYNANAFTTEFVTL